MQHDAGIVLFCVDDLLVVSVDKESEEGALYAERRLDNVGDISVACLGIEVGQILA